MSKDLAQFDSLKADITLFVAPVQSLKVSDFKSSADAIEAGKQVKALMKQVEDKRKALVGPLNDQVKLINGYAKDITGPLERAEAHIKTELGRFAEEQEKIKQEELRRAEEERRKQEAKAEEERHRMLAEAEEKKKAELAELEDAQAAAQEMFGTDEASAEEAERMRKEIEERNERERLETEARLDRERAIRDAQAKQTNYDISQNQIKNVRKTLRVEVVDINKVPTEYLIRTLNDRMALAAHKGGVEIPGLKFHWETSVALGEKTYVPKRALSG